MLARITGFGQTGPYAARAGFGTLAEAMSGFAHLTGEADGPPTLPAFGLADSICGIAASSAISMALFERERNGGRGQVLDLSLLEPIMAAVGPGPSVYQQTGVVGTRHGNRSTNNAPRNTYRTSDDQWVAISTSAQAIAERVLRLVGHPEVIDEPWFASGHTRAQHADLLDEYVGGWIASRTRDEVVAAFTDAGAAIAPIYSAQRPGRGRARPGDRDAHRGRRPGARPGAPAQRDVADVRDPGRGSGSPAARSAPTPTPYSPSSASRPTRSPACATRK